MQFPELPPQTAAITLPDGRVIPGFWTGPMVRATWAGAGNANHSDDGTTDGRFFVWNSPIFDLRPQFGDQQGQSADAPGMGTSPVYAPAGSLYVQTNITESEAVNLDTLNITVFEEAHPWNPFSLLPITSEANVTTQFTTATRPYGLTTATNRGVSGLGIFTPPMGGSGPIRFWRLTMIWRRFDQLADPKVTISGSFY